MEFRRILPPRVRIAYDDGTSRDPPERELPFVVGVLADFSGQRREPLPGLWHRTFVEVDRENFDGVLAHLRPRVAFEVDDRLSRRPSGFRVPVDLEFESLDDFLPDRIAPRIGPLRELLELRRALEDARDAPGTRREEAAGRAEVAHPEAARWIRDRLDGPNGARGETAAGPGDVEGWSVKARIAAIDDLASGQLDPVMHHPSLQRLEAAWRGLRYLLDRSETSQRLRIRILSVSKQELRRDFEGAASVEDTALFRKVHEEVYTVPGAEPLGVLLGDFAFTCSRGEDCDLLRGIAGVAAAAHAPFVAATSSETFELESFRQIERSRRPEALFALAHFAKWRAFRKVEESRYVALTLPRILLRPRYGSGGVSVEAFRYEEQVGALQEGADGPAVPGDGPRYPPRGADHHLWGNAAWALGAQVTRAFAQYGWCAAIWGVESGGLVQGLPVAPLYDRHGLHASQCPVEWPIMPSREAQLADLGFLPIVHCKGTPHAAFFSSQTAHQPEAHEQDEPTVRARLAARLPFVFATSRFAHYLKVIVRDAWGGFGSAAEVEAYLDPWIARYTNDDEGVSADVRARHPLREARVEIVEVPGAAGRFDARLDLWPRFQLHGLTGSIRVSVRLRSLGSR